MPPRWLAFNSRIEQHSSALTISRFLGLPGFQLQLNLALVGRGSLDALPLADELLSLQCDGERLRVVEDGDASWSNVGPRHMLRLAPKHGFESMDAAKEFFSSQLTALAAEADRVEGRLMPGGMHPWLRTGDIESWPHGGAMQDAAVHTLFGKRRHGWGNQQPLHLSLPFASEQEFAPLYASLRFLLPLMPALSAASPFAEGKRGPALQCRLAARHDYLCSHPVFALTSVQRLVPPALRELNAFESLVTEPLTKGLQRQRVADSLPPKQVSASGLWVDPIAGHIEIRMLDGQECLQSNLAICAALQSLTSHLSFDSAVPTAELDVWPAARLDELVQETMRDGAEAILRDGEYLRTWGFPEGSRCRAGELLQFLWEERLSSTFDDTLRTSLHTIVHRGTLAARLLALLPPQWDAEALFGVYRTLVSCLRDDTILS